MELDSLSREEVLKLELATGVPVVFKLDGTPILLSLSVSCILTTEFGEQNQARRLRRRCSRHDSLSRSKMLGSLICPFTKHAS